MRRWFASLMVIIVSFLTIILADQYLRTEDQIRNEQLLAAQQRLVALRLETAFQESMAAVTRVATLLAGDPAFLNLQHFDSLAALFVVERGALQRLLFVDVAGQVQHVYSTAEATPLLGQRLLVPADLSAGPPVVQTNIPNGLALWSGVMRKGRLVGAMRGEMDAGRLLQTALVGVDGRLAFRLEGAGGTLAGEQAPVFNDELHSINIATDNVSLTLMTAWREGAPVPDPVLRSFLWLLGGLFMLSSLTLVNRHFDYARGMSLAVSSRIRALREETQRLGHELQERLMNERTQDVSLQLFDSLPVGVFLTDARGDFIYVNERWCHITGLQREQSLGKGWMKALEGRDKERVLSDWYGALRDGVPYAAEVRFRPQEGCVVWVLIQAERQAGGEAAAGYIGFASNITLRKQHEVNDAAVATELQEILDCLQDPYYRVDRDGRILRLSRSVEALLGYREDELLGRHIGQLCCSRQERQGLLRRLKEKETVHAYEMRLRHKEGRVVWAAVNARYCQGAAAGYVEGTACDISDRKQMEARIARLSQDMEQAAEAALISDPRGIIEYVNPAYETMTGYRCEELIGKSTRLLKSGKQGMAFYEHLWQTILNGDVFSDLFINRRKDGTLYYEQKTITPLKDEQGRITHFLSTGQDVTQRVAAQQQLRLRDEHDALTELPNRALFMDILKKALVKAGLHRRYLAVMFLDMDCFKEINDNFGHEAGDQALKIYARRLQGEVREEDVVARIGGDEFAILVDDVASVDTISRIARKIVDAVSPPIVIDGREMLLTVSIGISVFPEDGTDAEVLLKNADTAMYRAKDLGHNSYQFYSADMRAKAMEWVTMENSLRHALERGEFLLHYQPQLDLHSDRVFGTEALLRWQHPELGLLSPGDFVPLLEESGLIGSVGEWVLETAFAQGRAWHEAGFDDLRISVNLSSRQFNDPGFIDKIAAIIRDSGIAPQLLELELTESVIMRNSRTTNMALERLDKMGVKFSIDDFGSGYSSLSYLKRFPVDTLKIDRSFVRDVDSNPDDAAIVTAIIGMGHNMNLNVIAEGVEQPVQLEFLRNSNCDAIQGYLFSQPLLPSSMTRLLREKKVLH